MDQTSLPTSSNGINYPKISVPVGDKFTLVSVETFISEDLLKFFSEIDLGKSRSQFVYLARLIWFAKSCEEVNFTVKKQNSKTLLMVDRRRGVTHKIVF